MSKADQYRVNAADCRLLSVRMHDSVHRLMTLTMAEDWDKMAEDADQAGNGGAIFLKRACPGFPK